MATTEQFSLRWNNFHTNMTSGFHDLLEAAEMVDVTLAVDGHFLQAHKLVLSICSPYFKQMFKVNPCKHPIVILKDVGHENMKDILEFMYMGEVSVLTENLTQFLRIAELLQVKGLTGDDSSEDASSTKDVKYDNEAEENEIYNDIIESDVELPKYSHSPPMQCSSVAAKRTKSTTNGSTNAKRPQVDSYQSPSKLIKSEFEPALTKNDITANNTSQKTTNKDSPDIKLGTELDSIKEPINLKTMWNFNTSSPECINSSDQGKPEKQPNKTQYQCGQCMKKFSRRDHLRTHEKNIHGEFAGPFKCGICSQLYKNTESLRKHISKFHFSTINETIQRIEVNA